MDFDDLIRQAEEYSPDSQYINKQSHSTTANISQINFGPGVNTNFSLNGYRPVNESTGDDDN